MDLITLKKIVAGGESSTVEFKHKANHPDKIMKEVCAFANTSHGGMLIIGVDDDGTIVGLKYAEDERHVLEAAMAKHFKYPIPFHLDILPINSKKKVLVYHIAPAEKKPIYMIYNFKRGTGKAYMRVGDKSLKASKEACAIMKLRARNASAAVAYGEKESMLLWLIREGGEITKSDFMASASIEEKEASTVLVSLAAAGVIRIEPSDEEDIYTIQA